MSQWDLHFKPAIAKHHFSSIAGGIVPTKAHLRPLVAHDHHESIDTDDELAMAAALEARHETLVKKAKSERWTQRPCSNCNESGCQPH